jgi:uncharacterized protein (DUF433 family)
MRGYDYRSGKSFRHSDAVWSSDVRPIEGKFALGFRDLVEVRFVDAFVKAGVSWKTLRRAHQVAKAELETSHPFCSNRLETDGRNILLRQASEDSDQALLNLLTNQREFTRIVQHFLKQLEFSKDNVVWWPLGKDRQILLDPRRNFGQPTVAISGVPAATLARSVKVNESVDVVARWFEVRPDEVRDAVDYEESLAAVA